MLTIGVEEEYLLIDPQRGWPVAASEQVKEAATHQPSLHDDVQNELLKVQVEIGTQICAGLDEVAAELRRLRTAVAAAAAESGCRLAATGTAPAMSSSNDYVPGERYAAIVAQAPQLAHEMLINGMHVHVGIADRRQALAVTNALRPWLHVLVAIGVNSPYWNSRDTGFASWRSIVYDRWPITGPPPHIASVEEYDDRIADLLATGVILDPHQVYWTARPSDHYDTVEVRTSDVQLRVDDAVFIAGLVHGLVATLLDDPERAPGAPLRPEIVRAANWLAARDGLAKTLVDPSDARPRPAVEVVERLVDRVLPALGRLGEADQLAALAEAFLERGTGAWRQRRAFRDGGMPALAELIVAETVA